MAVNNLTTATQTTKQTDTSTPRGECQNENTHESVSDLRLELLVTSNKCNKVLIAGGIATESLITVRQITCHLWSNIEQFGIDFAEHYKALGECVSTCLIGSNK